MQATVPYILAIVWGSLCWAAELKHPIELQSDASMQAAERAQNGNNGDVEDSSAPIGHANNVPADSSEGSQSPKMNGATSAGEQEPSIPQSYGGRHLQSPQGRSALLFNYG